MRYIGALDQGTTSTRFMIFDASGAEVARAQREHAQILPQPGWIEHNPAEIAQRTVEVIGAALTSARLLGSDLAAIGITNQRETTVVWNPKTGRPWHNAIVWQDTRTDGLVKALEPRTAWLRDRTGLPPATYFSAPKLQWMLAHIDGLRLAAERGEAIFGTIDSWLIWNLTGGVAGGRHVTDVTNASRTLLMDVRTREWDEELLLLFGIPRQMLPTICPSCHPAAFGVTQRGGPVGAVVPLAGVLGDQQAALIGQACFGPGEAKNTYGTGNFMLLNTGERIVPSTRGLLTTVAYQLSSVRGSDPGDSSTQPFDTGAHRGLTPYSGRHQGLTPVYALEGSVAVTGAAVQWLRDQLQIIRCAADIETLASMVPDSGGAYFVPAFSGLFAPYWRPDARGAIVGLSRFHTKAHLARATLEAICFQTRAVLDAMTDDSGVRLDVLKVDGGATVNDTLMQLQADVLGVPVVRPVVTETTALGAAYAAGLAIGFWESLQALRAHWKADRCWEPQWTTDRREQAYEGWQKAVERSLNWT